MQVSMNEWMKVLDPWNKEESKRETEMHYATIEEDENVCNALTQLESREWWHKRNGHWILGNKKLWVLFCAASAREIIQLEIGKSSFFFFPSFSTQ